MHQNQVITNTVEVTVEYSLHSGCYDPREDFYQSESYEIEPGKSVQESATEELINWSLEQPLQFSPGSVWAYSLSGYVLAARIMEDVGGMPYAKLVEKYVLEPLEMNGTFGGTETIVAGRNQVLYRLVADRLGSTSSGTTWN